MNVSVVCEGPADRRTLAILARREIVAAVNWLDEAQFDDLVAFGGLRLADHHWEWKTVSSVNSARPRPFRVHGFFESKPVAPYYRRARLALLQLADEAVSDAVVLVVDTDGERARLDGLVQARRSGRWPFAVVVGAAHCKREAWILAGFLPRDEKEVQRHATLRQQLGFDPCEDSERLTASQESAKRSAKRVLDLLTESQIDREDVCAGAPGDLLRRRGAENGLRDFLDEVRAQVAPAVGK